MFFPPFGHNSEGIGYYNLQPTTLFSLSGKVILAKVYRFGNVLSYRLSSKFLSNLTSLMNTRVFFIIGKQDEQH